MPTVLRVGRFRFFFYSNEGQEPPHIHVKASEDEAKFWLDPIVLAANHGFNGRELNEIGQLIERHQAGLLEAWRHGMSTSASIRPKHQRAYVPSTALAKSVDFDEAMLRVTFTDGRVLSVPLAWFPVLHAATPEQRSRCEIGGGGVGLHWPDLDEDLSIAGLMAGVDWQSA
jgi:hypothetical protein